METTQIAEIQAPSNAQIPSAAIPSPVVNVTGARRSRDGQYLILTLEDGRSVIKHVNFLKTLLGVPFTRKNTGSVPS